MKIVEYSYSHAIDIFKSPDILPIYVNLKEVVESLPHFQFTGKSESNTPGKGELIDTCQEHINSYFDYMLNVQGNWSLQPTLHEALELEADFRKEMVDNFR